MRVYLQPSAAMGRCRSRNFPHENRRFNDIDAGFQTAVRLPNNLVTQAVGDQRLLGFNKSSSHGQPAYFTEGGLAPCRVTGDGNPDRIGFRHAGRDGADARFGHQLPRR